MITMLYYNRENQLVRHKKAGMSTRFFVVLTIPAKSINLCHTFRHHNTGRYCTLAPKLALNCYF
jgi:hypothetical protein